jgi:hypothetical protein
MLYAFLPNLFHSPLADALEPLDIQLLQNLVRFLPREWLHHNRQRVGVEAHIQSGRLEVNGIMGA